MGEITKSIPKCLLKVNDRPILFDTMDKLRRLDIKELTVVRGYQKAMIAGEAFTTLDNDAYESTKDLYSLYLAMERLQGNTLILYGDCLYRSHLFADLLENDSDIRIVVDADISTTEKARDLVLCSKAYSNDFFNSGVSLTDIFVDTRRGGAHGEWTGLIAANERGCRHIREAISRMAQKKEIREQSVSDLLRELIQVTPIRVIYTKGGWLDIDDIFDYLQAGDF